MLDPTPKDSATPTNTPESTPLILVCYHKFSTPIIASEILRPIIVGAANMGANTSDGAKALQEKLESKLPKNLRLEGGRVSRVESSFLSLRGDTIANLNDSAQDSRICDEKCGLQGKSQGSYLSGNDRRDFSPLPHLSRKAESTSQAQSPVLRDDSGDNISHLNPHFCELTAMYWAWKNVDSSYYGLFHYRRILDLSEQALKAPPSLEPTQVNAKKKWRASAFGYTKERVDELLAHYDIILPQRYIDRKDNLDFSDMTLYDIYAKYHYAKDLDKAIELIKSRHPEMQAALEKVLFTKPPRWHIANMFIMRKELYFAYCEWLFPLLFALEAEIDISSYDSYQARIYGFLAERIFNIWLEYQRQTTQPRILEAPMILFMHKKPLIGWEINEKYKRFYFFGLRLYKKRVNPKN